MAENEKPSAAKFGELVGINRRATASKLFRIIRTKYVLSDADKSLIDGILLNYEFNIIDFSRKI